MMVAVVAVMVAVVVTPSPVLLLFLRTQFAEIPIGITMGLVRPPVVIDVFVVVPGGIVGVIGVVHTIIMMFAGDARPRCRQSPRQEQSSNQFRSMVHFLSSRSR